MEERYEKKTRRRGRGKPYVHAVSYEVGLCYGGPEEGGWWFSAGEMTHGVRPIRIPDRFIKEIRYVEPDYDEEGHHYAELTEKGHRWMRKLNRRARHINKVIERRRDSSSVIGDDQTEWHVVVGKPARHFPTYAPHYC